MDTLARHDAGCPAWRGIAKAAQDTAEAQLDFALVIALVIFEPWRSQFTGYRSVSEQSGGHNSDWRALWDEPGGDKMLGTSRF